MGMSCSLVAPHLVQMLTTDAPRVTFFVGSLKETVKPMAGGQIQHLYADVSRSRTVSYSYEYYVKALINATILIVGCLCRRILQNSNKYYAHKT